VRLDRAASSPSATGGTVAADSQKRGQRPLMTTRAPRPSGGSLTSGIHYTAFHVRAGETCEPCDRPRRNNRPQPAGHHLWRQARSPRARRCGTLARRPKRVLAAAKAWTENYFVPVETAGQAVPTTPPHRAGKEL
jgi:hypothetical protein